MMDKVVDEMGGAVGAWDGGEGWQQSGQEFLRWLWLCVYDEMGGENL